MSRSTSPPSSSEREPRPRSRAEVQAKRVFERTRLEEREEGGVVGIEWVLGC